MKSGESVAIVAILLLAFSFIGICGVRHWCHPGHRHDPVVIQRQVIERPVPVYPRIEIEIERHRR